MDKKWLREKLRHVLSRDLRDDNVHLLPVTSDNNMFSSDWEPRRSDHIAKLLSLAIGDFVGADQADEQVFESRFARLLKALRKRNVT
jgi:hypothetical protein